MARQRLNLSSDDAPARDTSRLQQLRSNPRLSRKSLHEHVAKLTHGGKLTGDVKKVLKDTKVLYGAKSLTRQQYTKTLGKTLLALKEHGVKLSRQAQQIIRPSGQGTSKVSSTGLQQQFHQQVRSEIRTEEAKGPTVADAKELHRQEKRAEALKTYNIRQAQDERRAEEQPGQGVTAAASAISDPTEAPNEKPQEATTASGGSGGAVQMQGGGYRPAPPPVSRAARLAAVLPASAGGEDNPPPPTVTTPAADAVLTFPDAAIEGKTEPRAVVTVLFEGNLFNQLRLTGTADADGHFVIPLTQEVPVGMHVIQVLAARPRRDGTTGVPSLPTAPLHFRLAPGAGPGGSIAGVTSTIDEDLPL